MEGARAALDTRGSGPAHGTCFLCVRRFQRHTPSAVRSMGWMRLTTHTLLALAALFLVGGTVAEARDAGADIYVVKDGTTVRKLATNSKSARVFVDVARDLVYRVKAPHLEATDLAGRRRWRQDLGIEPTSFVAGCWFRDPKVLVLWTSRRIYGLAKTTGKVLYRIEDPDKDPTQLFDRDGQLYLVDRYANPRLRRLDPRTGRFLWTARPLPDKAQGGYRHLGAGWLQSYRLHYRYFDPATGTPLPVQVPSSHRRALVATADALYALDAARSRVAAHDPRTGKKRWDVAVPKTIDRLLPNAAHGRLLLGSKDRVHVLDLATRTVRFAFPFDHGRGGAEVRQHPRTVIAADGSTLMAYDAASGALAWKTPGQGPCAAAAGPAGQVLEVAWSEASGAERGTGVIRARRVRDGKVLWSWTLPPFAHRAQLFAGVHVEVTQRLGLLVHVRWHVLD